jgi:hypothetical protein
MSHWILSRAFISVQRENRRLEKIADNWRSVICQDGEERVIPHSNGLNDVKLVNEMRTSRSDLFKLAFEKNKGPSEEEITSQKSLAQMGSAYLWNDEQQPLANPSAPKHLLESRIGSA